MIPIGPTVAEDAEMSALVEAARAPFLAAAVDLSLPVPMSSQCLTEPIDTVVGHVDFALDRRNALESTFNDAMADALRNLGGTQLAVTPGFRYDAVIPGPSSVVEDNTVAVGDVTLEDVYRFFPVSYTIATGETSGANVRQIVETLLTQVFSTDAFAHGGGWVDGFSGLDITLDLSRPDGGRVQRVRLSETGEELQPDRVVTMTGCIRPLEQPGTLCSHAGFQGVAPLTDPETGEPWTPVNLFIRGLQSLALNPRPRVTDVSGIPAWPETPFVQPLMLDEVR